jgi:hypothetical protein
MIYRFTFKLLETNGSRDSAVGIVTCYGLGLQTGSGAHPASYPMGTGGKAAGA